MKEFKTIFFLLAIIPLYLLSDASESVSISAGLPLADTRSPGTVTGHNSKEKKALPLCKENEHIIGQWKLVEHITQKDFICCGWDGTDYNFNNSACGTNRFGQDMPFYYGSNKHFTHSGGNACECDKHEQTRLSPSTREKYVWEPTHCRLLPWNAKQFCQLLENRHIVLAGDSTMEQHTATLASMIFEQQGGCANKIMFLHNEFLTASGRYISVTEMIEGKEPDIMIINSGAHFHSVETFQESINYLDKNLLEVMGRIQNTKVVIRGQHPGHANCKTFGRPLQTYDVPTEKDKYDWYLHRTFDNMLEQFVASHNHSRLFYWDTYPLYLRPDAHPLEQDCLHFCLPGPISFESNLFLTKLYLGEL
jgi:hypothetical protein